MIVDDHASKMTALDRVLPTPRLLETDSVDLAARPQDVWSLVRHGNLARSPLIRTLFALRTLPSRINGANREPFVFVLQIDHLVSSRDRPGFHLIVDDPPHELVVGAIGQVWKPDIPFVHTEGPASFAAFAESGYVKVAWALRVQPLGQGEACLTCEVRVDATDEESWRAFRRYFRVIGPASRFIRRSALASLARELGVPAQREEQRLLDSDSLLPDAEAQATHAIKIAAAREAIWPWLVQMGCRRAGFYAIDILDNDGVRSAREIHHELQRIGVGDRIPATPDGADGFEVLRVDEPRSLVLGGLYDIEKREQLPFNAPRPPHFWHVSWAFHLEPIDASTTILHARGRAAFPMGSRGHASWVRPIHHFMQLAQLRHLAARVEGRIPRNGARDVLEGVGGAAEMLIALFTPFMRGARSHWGLGAEAAARELPGDALVPQPRWSWTHAVEIDAPARDVWPWVAQVGADRAGFYSYQWLENVAGCNLRNADAVHPEWAVREGDAFSLHPDMPSLRVVEVAEGRDFVAFAAPDEVARSSGKPWTAGSWLFLVEPLGDARCRLISRFRSACSDEVVTRLTMGFTLLEPVGFVMDRRMLLGVKDRAERLTREAVRTQNDAEASRATGAVP